jgi:type IX secretion system PorP/SprF family membrane protein
MLVVCLSASLKAQDIHFTQFFATPLFTNPAFTGHFDATYRFSGIIRQQWASVSPQPFQTFGGGVDINGPLGIKPVGVGMHLAQDQAGLSNLTSTQLQVFLAGHIPLSSSLTLHLGASGGGYQQSIDYSRLSFGDQFNGIRFDDQLTTNDAGGRIDNSLLLNIAGGGFIEYRKSERLRVGLGYSLYNINEPDRSFNPAYAVIQEQRHNVHLMSAFPIAAAWDLMPAVQFMRQGTQDELLIGSAVRYHLSTGPVKPQSIQLGVWGRAADAANISVGFQTGGLYLGGAYDVNLSSLQPATRYRGGWEFAVIYTLSTVREKVKRLRQCPDYL